MTKIETMGIMAILKAAYPMFYKNISKSEAEGIITLWTEMFIDDDFNLVKSAVKAHIVSDTSGYPPIIGKIKASLVKISNPTELTEQEAWNLVSKAIKNSAYHATEEFDKLPDILKQLVGSPSQLKEWGQMESDTVQAVVASNFMRSYKVRANTEREYKALPNDIKTLITNVSDKLKLDMGGNNDSNIR